MVPCEKYFDIVNHLCVAHKRDGQTDGQGAVSNSAL